MKKYVLKIALPLLLLSSGPVFAQGTLDDYNRAYSLRQKFSGYQVYHSDVNPHWVTGTSSFWYLQRTPQGNEYLLVDADRQTRRPLFVRDSLAVQLQHSLGRHIDARNLPLDKGNLEPSLDVFRFVCDGYNWRYEIAANRLTRESKVPPHRKGRHWMETDDEKEWGPVTSPDGKYEAYIRNDNIFVRDKASGRERQLSQDGTLSNYYSSYIQWSPDSRKVLSCRIRPVQKRYVYYVESSPRDQLQPKLHQQEYAKPGDELPFKVPCIFHVETGRRCIPETSLFAHQYSLSYLRWDADSKSVTFEYNERGHKTYRVLELSAEDGKVRTLIEEKEEKYVNYPLIYRNYLQDGKHILWTSERDNYNHLYLYDRTTGRPVRQITKGRWYVRGVQHVDEQNQWIYFSANGMNPKEDPYLIHYYRIGFDGKGLVELTPDEGMHQAWFSSDFYKAAYSACGCHDNRMDKIWWNELWMGYPVDSSYIESSNVEQAHRLERPLMLVVGEKDDNVDPASTMQVVNALIKANKDFELVVVPGAGHTMGDNFGEHKRYDFFVRHLMGVEPPKWNAITY